MFLDTIQQLVVIAAAVVGGLWAWRRYWVERTDQAALEIGIDYRTISLDANYLVSFDISLANRGKVKIQAKPRKDGAHTFDDGVEKLAHSGSLQLKRIQTSAATTTRTINWFESDGLERVAGVSEVNFLTEYEDPTRGNIIDFWMEPNETYHLGATLVLGRGVYLVKATFVAAGGDDNFWGRVTAIEVPTAHRGE